MALSALLAASWWPLSFEASVGVFVVLLTIFVLNRVLGKAPANSPPYEPGWIPFVGHAVDFGTRPNELLRDLRRKHGDAWTMQLFGRRITMLAGPAGHEKFFSTDEAHFNAAKAYQFTVPVFGKDVAYGCPAETLVEQRKMIGTGLGLSRLRSFVPMIEGETRDYFEQTWGDSGEASLFDALNEVTVYTSTLCLHGREIRYNATKEFIRLYGELDNALSPIQFFYPNMPLPSNWTRDRARKQMGELFQSIIDHRRASASAAATTTTTTAAAAAVEHADIVQTLMEASYKDGSAVTDEQIAGMMTCLLLAGQHTSNVTSSWSALYMLHDKEFLARVMEEQRTVVAGDAAGQVGSGDAPLTFDHVQRMQLLTYGINEALRLRPPIIFLFRKVLQPVEFNGYTIPAGDLVGMSPALAHRLPELWTNPDQYDPMRFERKEDKNAPWSYVPFGAGAHGCIGESFAKLQIKTVLSWLLRNYDIELVGDFPKPNYTTMIVGPTPPCTVRYRRRRTAPAAAAPAAH